FNGLRHRINWIYFTVLDGLAHPLYSILNFNNTTYYISNSVNPIIVCSCTLNIRKDSSYIFSI
ncbi:hypothetical protein, partial [uncultured Holdemanella sp.]|uniref:hypothetical protein n=1 Tax=uncultured Holdemanella sp. TaxID=1763549 RepID=UPI0025F5CF70